MTNIPLEPRSVNGQRALEQALQKGMKALERTVPSGKPGNTVPSYAAIGKPVAHTATPNLPL